MNKNLKLSLNKETLRSLSEAESCGVDGGVILPTLNPRMCGDSDLCTFTYKKFATACYYN